MDQHEEIEAVEPEASAEQVDPRDEKIANLEAQLAEAQTVNVTAFACKSRNGKPASSY